jgi:hypothetical protein
VTQIADKSKPGPEWYRPLRPRDLAEARPPTVKKCRICGRGPGGDLRWMSARLCRACWIRERDRIEMNRKEGP